MMLIEVIGDLLQTILGGVEFHHLGARGNALNQAVGIFHTRIDEHHALARHRHRAGGRCGIGLTMGVLAGDRVIGGRRLGGIRRRVAVSLGSRIGHGGSHCAVEQHARFQRHDHRRCQRTLTLGCP